MASQCRTPQILSSLISSLPTNRMINISSPFTRLSKTMTADQFITAKFKNLTMFVKRETKFIPIKWVAITALKRCKNKFGPAECINILVALK
jgi:hypothetical protein